MTSRHRHFEIGLILVIAAVLAAHCLQKMQPSPIKSGTPRLGPHAPYQPKGVNHPISWNRPQDHGMMDLWLVDPDSGKSRFIQSKGRGRTPVVYSPDGQRVAFFVDERLKVARADGSKVVDLTPGGITLLPGHSLSWSPDSETVAFEVQGSDRMAAIGVIRVDGTGFRVAEEDAGLPIWSPDGRQWIIAFGYDLYVTPSGGGHRRKLTEGLGLTYLWHPTWCPDGRHFAFCGRQKEGEDDIYLGSTDGSEVVNLTKTEEPKAIRFASWSPTSDEILCELTNPGRPWVICLVDVQTGRRRDLAKGFSPRWSPDGQRIAFGSDWSLMLMNRDGSSPRVLIENFREGSYADFFW